MYKCEGRDRRVITLLFTKWLKFVVYILYTESIHTHFNHLGIVLLMLQVYKVIAIFVFQLVFVTHPANSLI